MDTSTKHFSPFFIFIRDTSILIILSLTFTFVIHLIPSSGVPIGARLLPMFYVPFIAITLLNFRTGLAIAILSPITNHLLTGNPILPLVLILTIELTIYAIMVYGLHTKKIWLGVAAPLAYVLTKTVSSSLLFLVPLVKVKSPLLFWSNSIQNASIGLLILALLGIIVSLWKKK